MRDVIKTLDKITAIDLTLYHWLEQPSAINDKYPRYLRGQRRGLDESIAMCGNDVSKFINLLQTENED